MFESIREFVNALLEGRKFKCGVITYFFDDVNGFCKKREGCHLFGDMAYQDYMAYCDSDFKEIIDPKWYENIPSQGILCWVWDNDMHIHRQPSAVKIIQNRIGSSIGEELFYDAIGDAWDCAKPLTKEEVMQFIYEGQSDEN